jgi:tetratricopeptide (TPR) repeat protein
VARSAKFVALAAMLWLLFQNSAGNALAQAPPSTKNLVPEERALLKAVEREPGNVQLVGSLGEYYLHKEKWRESARWLSKAYALSAGSESIGYDLAFAYMQAGELQSAKRQIEQMLGRTDSSRLHNLLGEVEDRRANVLDAAREYHRAAEIDPSESNIFDLATFLLQHKKYVGFVDESIKFFRYGVSQFPRSSQMMVGLGVALYASEQYDEAVRVLCAAVDLDPTDRRPMEFLGKARKVSPELAEEVDRRLQDFVERYPENAAANYYYAFSLWERSGGEEGKNPDKIEGLLRKAVAQSPGWYEPHYQLGVLYESEKRYPEAIREMQKTIKIEPEFSPAHFRLAVLYNRTGDKSRATQESAVVQRIKNRDRIDETGGDVGK